MASETQSLSEEVVRLLANAANAVRLYPASSPLPAEAIDRFIRKANEATTTIGPLRYVVDPRQFRMGDDVLAGGQTQVVAFAETLHAMQVGQLIIAPDITAQDATAFMGVVTDDPAAVRRRGIRETLASAGVSRIAVIPVTLRASEEEGILGLDLATAPLEDIGREAVSATDRWYQSAKEGEGHDDVRTAIDRLEQATRDIATARVAEALMRLDEASRMRVLALSLRADSSGRRMSGMLDVIARMKPAALARLLRIVAIQSNTDPQRVAGVLELPPELARQVMALLAPSPRTETESGVPPEATAESVADAVDEPGDEADLDRQIALASPGLASGRALSTAVAVSRDRPTEEAVQAIGMSLAQAARDGAFVSVREALRRLDELSENAAFTIAVEQARATLADADVLADVVRAPMTDADAAIAGEVLAAAGQPGAEALLGYYLQADDHKRSLLRPVIRNMGEPLLSAASRLLRQDDSVKAESILRILPLLGDKRVIPVIQQGLEHLDINVRRAAVTALADAPGRDGNAALGKALGHWDPETKRFVIREIGRAGATEAIPSLVRILEDINIFERSHELKKEVIKCLDALGSPDALPVLRRWANRPFVFGRKNKELRFLARRAIEDLSSKTGDSKGAHQ